jgi:hypothetical protein
MHRPVAGKRARIAVDQEIGTISEGGSVVGIEADRTAPGQPAESGDAPPGWAGPAGSGLAFPI